MKTRTRDFYVDKPAAIASYRKLVVERPESEPVLFENYNAEDKARGYPNPRINGYDVIYWKDSE